MLLGLGQQLPIETRVTRSRIAGRVCLQPSDVHPWRPDRSGCGRVQFLPPTDLAGPSHSMFISDVFARRVHLNRPASIFHMNGLQATFDFDRFRFPKRPVFAGLAMSLHLLVAYTSLPLLQKPPTLARSVAFRPDQGSRSSGEDRPRPGREQRLR